MNNLLKVVLVAYGLNSSAFQTTEITEDTEKNSVCSVPSVVKGLTPACTRITVLARLLYGAKRWESKARGLATMIKRWVLVE